MTEKMEKKWKLSGMAFSLSCAVKMLLWSNMFIFFEHNFKTLLFVSLSFFFFWQTLLHWDNWPFKIILILLVCVCVSCLVVSDSLQPHGLGHQDPLSMGILQARILEWVAISFSRGSSWLRDWTQVSCIAGGCFTTWATREDVYYSSKICWQMSI